MKPDPLLSNLDSIKNRLLAANTILLFTDFDGTLVPIKEHPDHCFLDPNVGKTLSSLASRNRVFVAIVSGRELGDLQSRVGVDGIAYAGNHGLEIEGSDFSFREPYAESIREAMDGLARDLKRAVSGIPGAWIQDKGLSTSVHYRQVAPADVVRLQETVRAVATPSVDAGQIVVRAGKMVVEIRPNVDWNKGKAVGWLARQMSPLDAQPLMLYLGDDDTDEDVFKMWRKAISVCVGERHDTVARYYIPTPGDVHVFLRWLLDTTGANRAPHR
jgi:trehalose 6-phosphate phosphatase